MKIIPCRYFLQQNWVTKQVDSDTFVSGNFTFHYKCHPLTTLFPLPDSIPWSIHAEVFSGQHCIDQKVNIEHKLWKCVNIHAELHKNTLLKAKSHYYNASTSCQNPLLQYWTIYDTIVMPAKYDTWGHSGIYIFFLPSHTNTDFCY
jgi:hypothetical protein